MNADNIHLMAYWESIHLVSLLAQESFFRSVGFAVWFVGLILKVFNYLLSCLFLSFTLLFVVLSTTSASPSRVLNFQDGVALLFSSFIPWFSTFCRSKMLQ